MGAVSDGRVSGGGRGRPSPDGLPGALNRGAGRRRAARRSSAFRLGRNLPMYTEMPIRPANVRPLRDAIAFAAATLLVAAVATMSVRHLAQDAVDEEVRQNLLALAKSAAILVDPAAHPHLRAREQESGAEYAAEVGKLGRFQATNPNIKFVYTTTLDRGEVRFVLDPTPPGDTDGDGLEEKSHVFDTYPEASAGLLRALLTCSDAVDDEPYSDRWGTFLSAYTPIVDPATGRCIGALGIDYSVSTYVERMAGVDEAAVMGVVIAGILALGIGSLIFWLRRRQILDQRRIRRAVRDLRLVLDHVDEGLVMLDRAGVMSAERSAALGRWFGDGACATLVELVRPHDPRFAAFFKLGFDEVISNLLPLDMAVEQLPRRLTVGERTLAATYQPVLGADGALTHLLVDLKDVSAELARAQTVAEHQDLGAALEALGRDHSGFVAFMEESEAFIQRLASEPSTVVAEVEEARFAPLLRALHTLKSNMAMFGLLGFSALCHDLESHMIETGISNPTERAALADAWRRREARMRPLFGRDGRHTLEVGRSELREIVAVLKSIDATRELAPVVEGWGLDPVEPRLARLAEHARSLGPRLGKGAVEAEVAATAVRVDGEAWGGFWAALSHLIRNAVDHGLEPLDVRAAAGKTGPGRVALSAVTEAESFVVRVSDDGAGIDWDKVCEKAASLGLPAETADQRLEALFADGLSTRDEVSAISGRGVGLAAVRAETAARGGEVRLTTEKGRGTTWELRFPATALRPRRGNTSRVASATLSRLRAANRATAS